MQSVRSIGRDWWQAQDTAIVLGLALSWMLLGLVFGDDYGISWDEGTIGIVGESALRSYASLHRQLPGLEKLGYYGPAYAAMVSFGTRTLQYVLRGWEVYDLRHLLYSLSMPVLASSVYAIARGFAGRGAALFGSALLATQPLLVGHSFINPKDAPLTALLAASIACGMAAVRRIPSGAARGAEDPGNQSTLVWTSLENRVRDRWHGFPGWLRAVLATCLLAGLIVLLDMVLFRRIALPAVRSLVADLYQGNGPELLQQAYDREAAFRNVLPLDAYLHKATAAYESVVGWVTGIVALGAIGLALAKAPPRLHDLGRAFPASFLASAVLLGLATAVRVAGPFAGVLVSVLLIIRLKLKALAWVLLYWALAAAITIAAWPLLWTSPAKYFVRSLEFMADFPWNDPVVFRGVFIRATELPWDYALTQFGLQLTLPALVFGIAGGLWTASSIRRAGRLWPEVSILWIWLTFPLALSIVGDVNLYDNARQILFALPPLFVFAAVGFQAILDRLQARSICAALAIATLVPGVVATIQLHPYEYVYYNELAGGVGGASRRFELDYWGTGFREAMMYLNTIAPEGATYSVLGAENLAVPFARPDLRLWIAAGGVDEDETPDFVVCTSRWNWDLDPSKWDHYAKTTWWPDAMTTWTLERDGAPLVVIKAHSGGL